MQVTKPISDLVQKMNDRSRTDRLMSTELYRQSNKSEINKVSEYEGFD